MAPGEIARAAELSVAFAIDGRTDGRSKERKTAILHVCMQR